MLLFFQQNIPNVGSNEMNSKHDLEVERLNRFFSETLTTTLFFQIFPFMGFIDVYSHCQEMTVEWPMLLLYDEANQSDFVAAFDERYALEDHGFKSEVRLGQFLMAWASRKMKDDET